MTDAKAGEGMTARQFIEWITRTAESLEGGLDVPIDLAICDGQGQQFIDQVDVLWQVHMNTETGERAPGADQVVIVGHWHKGTSPDEYRRGLAPDADEELRKLTEGDGE